MSPVAWALAATLWAQDPFATPTEDNRDAALLGDPKSDTNLSADVAPEDPLKVGGQLYLRSAVSGLQSTEGKDWALSSPSLVDLYLDARPNDRVRGFVLGRMTYDPTLSDGTAPSSELTGMEASGASTGSAPLNTLFAPRSRGPNGALDQLWLRFDIARRVFVTAGKQHVRWGTARFWTPTDFLHLRRRNPLDVFDARTGTTMLKLHLPWESKGWNFYAFAVPESESATANVTRIATAARAEIVLGDTELGLGAFWRKAESMGPGLAERGGKPKLAMDLSTGLGEFDLYGELALRFAGDVDRVVYDGTATPRFDPMAAATGQSQIKRFVDEAWPVSPQSGLRAQAVGGFSYQRRYNDNDVWTLGGEFFYNGLGYDDPRDYPGLIFPRSQQLRDPATFFYLGRHYGALFFMVPRPYSWDLTTFTLSTLANLSDKSFLSRLDVSYTLLTHLQVELYAALHYGQTEGEFRLGVNDLDLGGYRLSRPPGLLDLGVAVRMSF